MEKGLRPVVFLLLCALTVISCTPGRVSGPATESGASSGGSNTEATSPRQATTLIVMTRTEPRTLLPKTLNSGVIGDGPSARRLFNAGLFLVDEREVPTPYLVEELPKLGTDTWKVLADGRMETTYKLRPNLTWHDGTPLTADDIAFAWKVYADPALASVFSATPQNLIEGSVVVDPRTIVVKWSRPSPDADSVPLTRFTPLPKHILEAAYEQSSAENFAAHPYWSREFVGSGPFKVDRWDAGVAIEASAFDGHALGRPRVDRLRLLWASDPNTVVANLLAGTAHITIDGVIRFQQGEILRNEWAASKGGEVQLSPIQTRYVQTQFRPEVVNPVAIHDLRVREAMLYGMDRKELADALLGGQGTVAHVLYTEQRENYADIDRAVKKYPYDPRRSEQIMIEAGLPRGRDGFYVQPNGEPFAPEMRALGGAAEEQELTILTDLLRRSGFNIQPFVVPTARAMDGQYVATFPAFSTSQTSTGGDTPLVKLITSRIPTERNRWSGTALGGWSNTEYDRGHDAFSTLLDRQARNDVLVQMLKLVSEELPIFPLYYNLQVDAHVAGVSGVGGAGDVTNVHEWQYRPDGR